MAKEVHRLTEPLIRNTEVDQHPGHDLKDIKSIRQFLNEAKEENKRIWKLAGPAIFASIARYSLGATTQIFAGHLTVLELDAVSTANMVISGLAFGIMLGMGSALETLCGQAYGAKQLQMLGVYMQRSWIILTIMCIFLLPIYLFATPILLFFHQNEDIASLAGKFSLYMIPQLFSYGLNFPIQKFLQAQSKVMITAVVSAAVLVFHLFLNWLLIVQLGLGLVGAAIALNASWWILVSGQFAYIAMGYCHGAWNGFSRLAFKDLGSFTKLSIGSAIMMCLEFWFLMILIVIAGNLKNAQIAVGAMSICMNLYGWQIMIFFGLNAAISVRISNELGAGRPRAAQFSVLVVLMSSVTLGIFFFVLVVALRDVYGIPFTNNTEVVKAVSSLAILFACSLFLNSIQPVLSGVAVGAGWQWLVAYVNLGCYYLIGFPLGYVLGFLFDKGIQGMWIGQLSGIGLQTAILIFITCKTNWDYEASQASSRIQKWGGPRMSPEPNSEENPSLRSDVLA
ncbi:Protein DETOXIFICATION [Rhynchospora pubera]|uniref:Protein DETOXIFICATION n=1 Tax=Rhynchospora pubera TaxID=906938 RepID=A0AAV8E8N1_9POAL|nr:Protein DETOXIFICATION [Rhynchospora pubera]